MQNWALALTLTNEWYDVMRMSWDMIMEYIYMIVLCLVGYTITQLTD